MGTCYTAFLEAQHPKAPATHAGWQCVAQFDLGKAYELHRHVPTVRLYDLIGPANRNASAAALEALRFEPNHIGCLEGDVAISEALRKAWAEVAKDLDDELAREASQGAAGAPAPWVPCPWFLQFRAIRLVAEDSVRSGSTVRLILVGS